jgi:hypothetical protein
VQGEGAVSTAGEVIVEDQIGRTLHMYRTFIFGLLAGNIGLISVTQAGGPRTCRPALAFKEVRFSEMQPPKMERKWTAVLSVDASRCATASGQFGIVFSRLKETGPEIEFRERFTWKPTLIEVSTVFAADEAVEGYWLYDIAPCPCRD